MSMILTYVIEITLVSNLQKILAVTHCLKKIYQPKIVS